MFIWALQCFCISYLCNFLKSLNFLNFHLGINKVTLFYSTIQKTVVVNCAGEATKRAVVTH